MEKASADSIAGIRFSLLMSILGSLFRRLGVPQCAAEKIQRTLASNQLKYNRLDLEPGLDRSSSSRDVHTGKQQDEEDGESEDLAIKAQIEEYTKFAYLALGLCYVLLYSLLLKTLGRMEDEINGVMVVHVWSIVIMVLFFISWFLPCPFAVMKVVRLVISGLLFASSLILVVLLHLTL